MHYKCNVHILSPVVKHIIPAQNPCQILYNILLLLIVITV